MRKEAVVPNRERYLRTSDVARMLQVSPKTVSRWAKEGRLPYLATLGGHRRYPENAMESLMEQLSRLQITDLHDAI
jgi:excisionase family DNA binding protein